MPDTEKLIFDFTQAFDTKPEIFKTPLTVHLFGGHCDQFEGKSISVNIDSYFNIAISPRSDYKVKVFMNKENFETGIFDLGIAVDPWQSCIENVIGTLLGRGLSLFGFNMMILASDECLINHSFLTALACSLILAVNKMFTIGLSRLKMINIFLRSNNYPFVKICQAPTMYLCLLGKKGHCLFIDQKTQHFEFLPLRMTGLSFLLFDANPERSHLLEKFRKLNNDSLTAFNLVKSFVLNLQRLADINTKMLHKYVLPESPSAFQSVKFLLLENDRTIEAVNYIKAKRFDLFAQELIRSHDDLISYSEIEDACFKGVIAEARKSKMISGYKMLQNGFLCLISDNNNYKWSNRAFQTHVWLTGREPSIRKMNIVSGIESF
ncbi:hypothetical protein ASU31_00740 [Pedobacter ginsenosidimutans]|uniref:Galactokinase N-terminal domain-containing protein n=1 Tax=Pedobacter ginsenosidimutans TaxID=687842 RepID=A0A0T5VVK2_9SPHI|nr:hypothetical protein [Pedobacter ginsenosidimutans]KRT17853.1 hypothetical protein ASU31_00740 [Pedobacter ginsenosidimutans]